MLSIEIANEQDTLTPDATRLRMAVERVLTEAGVKSATVSLAIVDDPTIHQLNGRYLAHDEATDVLSFLLERDAESLEGEIIASADTALRESAAFGWSGDDELLLYVIHGALHLVGYDDLTDVDRQNMRAAEQRHLARFDLEQRTREALDASAPPSA